MEKPFNLIEDFAILVSRYMVEDAIGEYVYEDEENEQKREVVKSIIHNIIS